MYPNFQADGICPTTKLYNSIPWTIAHHFFPFIYLFTKHLCIREQCINSQLLLLPPLTISSFRMFSLNFMCLSIFPLCLCVHHICSCGGQKMVSDALELELDGCKAHCECREWCPCPLEEQPVLLSIEHVSSPHVSPLFSLTVLVFFFFLCLSF
jgi:hypothetical protein